MKTNVRFQIKINLWVIIAIILLFSNLTVLKAQDYMNQKIIFDDFIYSSVQFPVDGDSSCSIFGKNYWITKNGKISERAWHRFNVEDGNFAPTAGIETIKDGFRLTMSKGYTNKVVGPIIRSISIKKSGTWAARIHFDKLHEEDKMIQAFWLFTPVAFTFKENGVNNNYSSECDIELNNWFAFWDKKTRVHAHNHRSTKLQQGEVFQCICEDNEGYIFKKECLDLFNGKPILENQWFEAMIVVDSIKQEVRYSMRSDNWDSTGSKVWAGSGSGADDWGNPVIISKYYPRDLLAGIFSMHCDSAKNDYQFDIDWYYYTDRVDIGFDEITKYVGNIRSDGIERLNTSGNPLYYFELSKKKGIIKIVGGDSAYTCKTSTWSLITDYSRSTAFNIDFKYRYYKCGLPLSWTNIYDVDFQFRPEIGYDSLEFYFTLYDEWSDYKDTASKMVTISNDGCPSPDIVFEVKNVAQDIENSTYLINIDVNKSSRFSISVFDVLGKLVSYIFDDELPAGIHAVEFDAKEYSTGIYFINIKAGGQTQTLKVYK
ncbi:MAG: hypothetical protein QG635_258 [Bacteroidota bacterium]|nr:hypothetical protein [Bacteroidota bacterium]